VGFLFQRYQTIKEELPYVREDLFFFEEKEKMDWMDD